MIGRVAAWPPDNFPSNTPFRDPYHPHPAPPGAGCFRFPAVKLWPQAAESRSSGVPWAIPIEFQIEPDPLMFADAAARKPVWKKALEGWNVRESSAVNEWIAEARVEGRAEGEARGEAIGQITALVAFLEARFGQVPADLEGAIRLATDPTRLKNWVPLAARAATLAEFRAAAGV